MIGLRKLVFVVAHYRQDILVVLAGLIVFLALMAGLAVTMFPQGQRLGDLDAGDRDRRAVTGRSNHQVSFSGSQGPGDDGVARLTRVVRDVGHRGGSDVAWSTASESMSLANRDAVQTQDRSKAFISFVDGGHLRLDEKSLVVIRGATTDPFAGLSRPAVVMVRGQLSGEFDTAGPAGLDVETPVGLVSLSGTHGDALKFALDVDDAEATRVSVLGGEGEIVLNGERTAIGAYEALTIDADGRVSRHRVPGAPQPIAPASRASVTFGGVAPPVDFRWGGDGADSYRLRIALDANFENVLVDRRTGEARYRTAALRPGQYWWEVSGIVAGHVGPPSEARALTLVRDDTPPPLALDPVPGRVSAEAVTLSGLAAPGARIFVRGEPVTARPDGRFEHVVTLDPGTNIVVVEAVDRRGNVAFASATVTSKRITSFE